MTTFEVRRVETNASLGAATAPRVPAMGACVSRVESCTPVSFVSDGKTIVVHLSTIGKVVLPYDVKTEKERRDNIVANRRLIVRHSSSDVSS